MTTQLDLESRQRYLADTKDLTDEAARKRIFALYVVDDLVRRWCSQNIEEQEAFLRLLVTQFPPDQWPSAEVLRDLGQELLVLNAQLKGLDG